MLEFTQSYKIYFPSSVRLSPRLIGNAYVARGTAVDICKGVNDLLVSVLGQSRGMP